jgi:folate-binding protein YgfZ
LLQPQGKLLVSFDAHHKDHDEWWLLCEHGFGGTLAQGLGRFKIRVKADIETRTERVLAVRGAEAPGGETVVQIAWDDVPAYDVVGPEPPMSVPFVDDSGYERARIEAGVPRLGLDIDDRTIPQEAGLERAAVSFTKGCFVGQELVCRIDTRGHVNRYLRRLRGIDIRPGAEVRFDGQSVGQVTTSAGDVALAMLRREVTPGATVQVAGAGRDAIVEEIASRAP